MKILPTALVLLLIAGLAAAGDAPVLGVDGTIEEIRKRLELAERKFRKDWGGLSTEEIAPAPVKDRRNRALPIIEAVRLLKELLRDDAQRSWFDVIAHFSPTKAQEYSESHESELRRYEPVLSSLETIDLYLDSNFGVDYGGVFNHMPIRPLDAINAGRLLALSVLVDLSGEDCRKPLRRLDLTFAFADAFAREPDTIMQIARVEADRLAVGLLREMLSHCELPRKELQGLSLVIQPERRSPIEMNLFDYLVHDRALFDSVENNLEASEDEDRASAAQRALVAGRLQTLRFYDEFFAYVSMPRWERGEKPTVYSLGVPDILKQQTGDEPETTDREAPDEERLSPEAEMTLLVEVMVSNLPTWLVRSDLWETRFRLARAAIALELHAKDHEGRYPAGLENLVPHYLELVPVDPFSGDPFEYEATDEGYRLAAGEKAHAAWEPKTDPVLDWSLPRQAEPSAEPPAGSEEDGSEGDVYQTGDSGTR